MNSNGKPNIMYNGTNNNIVPQSISSMGGGTPIRQLRSDIDTHKQNEDANESNKIKYIANDINNDSDIGPPKRKNKKKVYTETESETDETVSIEKPKNKKTNNETTTYIPEMLKDPILIWLLFMLMSQNFFKNLIGKYLKTINPDEDGIVGLGGIAMYGLIFSILFTVIKFILKQLNKY